AAADDEILGPSGDPEVAVGVDPAKVAGPEIPALGEEVPVLVHLGIGRPLEYAGVGDADLADLVHRTFLQDPAIGVRVQDADVAIGQWNANRSDLLAAIHRVAGDKTGRLGQAIAFGDLHAGRLLEPVVE